MKTERRNTKQGEAVLKVFEALNPLTVTEIFKRAKCYCPDIGITTIYRQIRALLEDGIIVAVYGINMPASYVLKTTHEERYSSILYQLGEALYYTKPNNKVIEERSSVYVELRQD